MKIRIVIVKCLPNYSNLMKKRISERKMQKSLRTVKKSRRKVENGINVLDVGYAMCNAHRFICFDVIIVVQFFYAKIRFYQQQN